MYQAAESEAPISEETKAVVLTESWKHFLDLAEQSRDLVNQPLALVGALAEDVDPVLCGPMVIRVDRSTSVVKVASPLPQTPIMDAFEKFAPNT